MNLLMNSLTSNFTLLAQETADEGGAGGVLLFILAIVLSVLANLGKDNAVSAKVKRSLKVSDPNWGVMFGLFVFAFALGALPNLFNLISDGAVSDNAVNGFRMSGLMLAIFSGLYLIFRAFCESSSVREPEQAWRLAVVASVTILGALYIGVKHDGQQNVSDKFKLGVDLAGGANLVYKISGKDAGTNSAEGEAEGVATGLQDEDMQGLLSALGRRLNPSGALDLILRPYGNNTHVEIVVPAATAEEVRQLKEIITNTGALEFLIQVGVNDTDHASIKSAMEDSFKDEDSYNTSLVKSDGQTVGRWVKVGKDLKGQFEYNAASDGSIKRVFYHDGSENQEEVSTPVLLSRDELAPYYDRNNPAHEAIKKAFASVDTNAPTEEFSSAVLAANVTRIEVLMAQPEASLITTGDDLKTVRSQIGDNLRPSVAFTMKAGSASKFGRFTAKNVEKQLSIVLDGNLLSSANIKQRISENGTITGDFTQAEVDSIIGILRAGALPSTLLPTPVSENKMGASLGTVTIQKGQFAIVVSMVVVLLFMILWYLGVPGVVAAFALVLNLILILAVMVMIGASFTLSGMAGLVLTVGMAVDANVLIFERIREELADGARIKAAIRNGFSRATITIIDANLTTLITAILLYAIGTDQIRGFAITLILGIIMSMFTAIYASRGLFAIAAGLKWIKETSWCLQQGRLNRINVEFISKAKFTAVFSAIIIVAGLALTVNRQSEMLAIDLSGGTSAIFQLNESMEAQEVETAIESKIDSVEGLPEAVQYTVTSVDLTDGRSAWRVNTDIVDQSKLQSLLANAFPGKLPVQSISVTKVAGAAEAPENDASSAVERVMPQFVAYQEEAPEDAATEEKPEVVSEEESENPAEPAPANEGPAAPGEEATVPVPPLPMPEPSPEIPLEEPVEGTSEDIVELQSVTLQVEQKIDGEDSELSASVLEGMIDAAQTETGLEIGKVEGNSADQQVTIYGLDDSQVDILIAELIKTDGSPHFEETQKFGATIAGDMTKLGTYAIVFSFIGIITYIWLRFQHVSFGIAAVVALVHDVLVTLAAIAISKYLAGFLMIEDFKISLPVIAAFLTIIGYSLNDTIVVFDRVREVRGKNREITADMLNRSVNSTLSRTLLTSLTTLFVVATLYVIGGSGIHSFAFALVIGVVVGTYSSIFVASPTLLLLNKKK